MNMLKTTAFMGNTTIIGTIGVALLLCGILLFWRICIDWQKYRRKRRHDIHKERRAEFLKNERNAEETHAETEE